MTITTVIADISNNNAAAPGQGTGNSSNAPFTWDQIANQLKNGYWTFNSESARSFALDATRTITYDVSRLSAAATTIAQAALDVWSAATGINFVSSGSAPVQTSETTDAANSTATTYTLGTNTVLMGNSGFQGDVDYYRVTLTAGQTYVVGMSGYTAGSNIDSVLKLLDSSGTALLTVDSEDPLAGEYLTYTATTTGTYYISAEGFEATTGNYELSIQTAQGITFGDMDDTGAYATSDLTGATVTRSYINIADNWSDLNLNSYMLTTYIHELGHALGLGHAGNYNGTATWPGDALYDNDSWSATVMSYFDQDQNTNDPNGFAYMASLMPADLIAIQDIYGAGPTGSQGGDTVWGPNGNVGGVLQQLLNMAAGVTPTDPTVYAGNSFSFTIYDTGGTDTFDVSVYTVDQTINLTAQTSAVNYSAYSSIGGKVGNVVIARGTVIENAIGGSAVDTITGNDVANRLEGRGGADTINGNGGDDMIIGGAGGDTLNGGTNTAAGDTLSYDGSVAGVTINLGFNTATGGDATGDIISGFENVRGSSSVDILAGDNNDNVIEGGAGRDTLNGVGNGPGGDTLSYEHSSAGVSVNLDTNKAFGGDAHADEILNFENILGSAFGDQLTGDAGNNVLKGGAGNDLFVGGLGADTMIGGADLDVVDYSAFTTGVSVNLTTGTGPSGDLISEIENITGSAFGDVLDGNNGANTMRGGAGNDFMVAGNGADLLIGGADNDEVSYATATTGVFVNLTTGVGANGGVLQEIENIRGSNFGDVLQGDNGANTIRGLDGNDFIIAGNGADLLIGGNDNDTVSYETATIGVFANLTTGIGANGGVLQEIENLTGSNFGDVLIGSALGNTLKGGGGNDYLVGNAGSDALYGGADNDTFRFETTTFGNDVIVDFQDNGDKLSFAAAVATNFNQFTILNNNTTNVTVQIAGQSIVVQGVANISLTAADFLFV